MKFSILLAALAGMPLLAQEAPAPSGAPAARALSSPANGLSCAQEDYRDLRVVKKVDPDYPSHARSSGVHGNVILRLSVNEKGVPKDVTVFKGLGEVLDKQAIKAARKWRFSPATCKDKPVAAKISVEMWFNYAGTK